METRYCLGKIDFANSGRNRNKVFVTFCDGADLCPKGDEHLMLSFEIKMANNHGNECSNQCQGVLAKYPEVAQFGVEPEVVEDAVETQEQKVIPYNAEGSGSQAEANELKEGA